MSTNPFFFKSKRDVNLGAIRYNRYDTGKKVIPGSTKLSAMRKYKVYIDHGSSTEMFRAETSMPNRKTGKLDFSVKLPRRIRAKRIFIYFFSGNEDCDLAYYREIYLDKFTLMDEINFEIDLHIDDTNPKR